jgi:hypothetical protein
MYINIFKNIKLRLNTIKAMWLLQNPKDGILDIHVFETIILESILTLAFVKLNINTKREI